MGRDTEGVDGMGWEGGIPLLSRQWGLEERRELSQRAENDFSAFCSVVKRQGSWHLGGYVPFAPTPNPPVAVVANFISR